MLSPKWQTIVVLACTFVSGHAAPDAVRGADDWAQWRGPRRDGQLANARWPNRLEEADLKLSWRVELGPGHLAIAGDEIFIRELKGISAWRWSDGSASVK